MSTEETASSQTQAANTDLSSLLLKELFEDRKRDRRHRLMTTLLFILPAVLMGAAYFLIAIMQGAGSWFAGSYVAGVRIDGAIQAEGPNSARVVRHLLSRAFEDNAAKGVALIINSPGGSPVQSSLIREALVQLRAKHPDKKLIVYGEDFMASGGYMVATGAERIYAHPSTVTGSIGVVMENFGLREAAERFGVEPRVFHAGEHKTRLSMFEPLSEGDRAKIQSVLGELHRQFITAVESSRGERLRAAPEVAYSGDFWTGEEAAAMGLIDGTPDLHSLLESEFSTTTLRFYENPKGLAELLLGDSKIPGASLLQGALAGGQTVVFR